MQRTDKPLIKKKDLRSYLFYINHIEKTFNIKLDADTSDMDSCSYVINSFLFRLREKDSQHARDYMNIAGASYIDNAINESEFSWIKNCERTTFWLWSQLYLFGNFGPQPLPFFDAGNRNSGDVSKEYLSLGLNTRPQGNHERYQIILKYFDYAPAPKDKRMSKIHILAHYCKMWDEVYKESKNIFKWLNDKDDDACSWAYEYSVSNQNNNGSAFWERYSVILPTPLTSKDKFLTVCAMYELWRANEEKKKLFLININKAWNQRKLRRDRVNKKAINSYIDIEVKKRLDILSYHYGKKINETLESIINEKYNELVGKKH